MRGFTRPLGLLKGRLGGLLGAGEVAAVVVVVAGDDDDEGCVLGRGGGG